MARPVDRSLRLPQSEYFPDAEEKTLLPAPRTERSQIMIVDLIRPLHRWRGSPPPERVPKRQINRGLCGRSGHQEPLGTRSNSGLIIVTHWYLMIYLRHTRLKIVDLKLQNGDSMLQIVNSKLRFVDSELQNPDSELRNSDLKLQNLDPKLQILDSELQNFDSKLQNVDSKLREVDSKLQNHAKTADRDRHPGSATAERATRSTHKPSTEERIRL